MPIVIGIGATFIFIFIMFETFGISEYVWPILFPILSTTFGIILFVFCLVGLVSSKGCNVPSDQRMTQHTLYPRYPRYDSSTIDLPTYDSVTTGAVYVIPTYCPSCMSRLELNKAEWIGPNEFTCPSCFSVVQVGVRENF